MEVYGKTLAVSGFLGGYSVRHDETRHDVMFHDAPRSTWPMTPSSNTVESVAGRQVAIPQNAVAPECQDPSLPAANV